VKIQLRIARVIYSLSPGYSRVTVEKIDIIPVKLFLASSALPQRLEHEKIVADNQIFLLLDNEHQAQEQSGIGQSTYTSHAISKAAVPACPGALQKFKLQIPIVPSTCMPWVTH
jgi:hypothetical protein